MRIFHNAKFKSLVPTIAREMINIEYGKLVYDGMKLLPYPWKPYLILKHNDNECIVDIRHGIICIPDYNREYKIFIVELTTELRKLDAELLEYPSNLISISHDDYVSCGMTIYVSSVDINLYRRTICDAVDRGEYWETGEFLYKWAFKSYSILYDYDRSFEHMMLSVSCIIWDPNHIFNYKNAALVPQFPTIADLSHHDKSTSTIFDIHRIFGIKWHIYGNKSPKVKRNTPLMLVGDPVLVPVIKPITFTDCKVYNELYENVNLLPSIIGVNNESSMKITLDTIRHFDDDDDIKTDDHINAKYREDICYTCGTFLYDDIYVIDVTLTLKDTISIQFGLCCICGSNKHIVTRSTYINSKNWIILVVSYPRTFKDVLELYNYSPNDKEIMNYIYKLQNDQLLQYTGSHIYGPDLRSYSQPQSIKKHYDKSLYMFRYNMC